MFAFFTSCRKKSKFKTAEDKMDVALQEYMCPLTHTVSPLSFERVTPVVLVPVPSVKAQQDEEQKEQVEEKFLTRRFAPGIYDGPALFRYLLTNKDHPMAPGERLYMSDFGVNMIFHRESIEEQIALLRKSEIDWEEYLRYKGLSLDLFEFVSTTDFSKIYQTGLEEEIKQDRQVRAAYVVPPDAREQESHRIVRKMVITAATVASASLYRNSPTLETILNSLNDFYNYLNEKLPILLTAICRIPADLLENGRRVDKWFGDLLNYILEELIPTLFQSIIDGIIYIVQNPLTTIQNIRAFNSSAVGLIDYLLDGAFKVAVFIFDKMFIEIFRHLYRGSNYAYAMLSYLHENLDNITNAIIKAANYLQEFDYSAGMVRLLEFSGEQVVNVSRFAFDSSVSLISNPAFNVPAAAFVSTWHLANESYEAGRISQHRIPFSHHSRSSKLYIAMSAFCVVMLGIDALTDCFGLSKHIANPTGLSPTAAGLLPLLTTVTAAFFGRRNPATPGQVAFEKFRENAFQYV